MANFSQRPNDVCGPIPLVIVQGFLGGTAAWLWGNFEHYLNNDRNACRRHTIFVSVGPVSSLHDRACELYYGLVGGTVDYGEEHAAAHRHARYGRKIVQGLYPQWSPDYPLHFLGHSIGGPTIIKLQSLIKQGHFGPRAHPKMLFSVNAISAPFRGTQAVYLLGERADAAPAVRPLTVGAILGKVIHILSFLSPLLPASEPFDMHGDCRSLSYREMSFSSLLKQLWKSEWAESRDATPFDVTFQAADERESNGEGDVDPETFYSSHVACMTRSEHAVPSMLHITSPLMYLSSRLMGTFDYASLHPSPSFCRHDAVDLGEEYWANDGIVPIFSQWHPLPCRRTRCQHLESSTDYLRGKPQPGIWYINPLEDANHMSIVPLWTGTSRQKQFWVKLEKWLSTIEGSRRVC